MSSSPQPMRRRRSVAKLLARLNPKGLGLPDGGGHGTAGTVESAIEIAAALGYVASAGPGPRMAVSALCLRWWPGAIEGAPKTVGYREVAVTDTLSHITGVRELRPTPHPGVPGAVRNRLARKTIERTRTELIPIERPAETARFRELADMLASRLLRRVARDAGPSPSTQTGLPERRRMESPIPADLAAKVLTSSFTQAWARAVIHEYRFPNVCQACHGYGETMRISDEAGKVKATVTGCEHCGGQGVMPWSVKRRAKALRVGEHGFRDRLNPHHNGALALLRELEYRAARQLLKRLGIPDE